MQKNAQKKASGSKFGALGCVLDGLGRARGVPRSTLGRLWLVPGAARMRPDASPKRSLTPKTVQERFSVDFLVDWARFFIDFRPPNPPKINQKSIKKSTQRPNNQHNKKMYFVLAGPVNSCPRPCYVVYKIEEKMIPKSFQKQFSNQHQTWIDFAPNLAPFWEVSGGQDGAKFAPRCLQDAIFFSFFF